ncbi:respiratory nitrate reductase alpha subunit apo domain protein [Mycobacterium kansasii 824]|nr:respiratory nitrate reductase alpha subunit apo domain protein [Mycobacterium kansasii 824]
MGGAHDLVVAPPVAVEDVAVSPALPGDGAQVVGEFPRREEPSAPLEEFFDPAPGGLLT